MHVGACMHVFLFHKNLSCLDEQEHAISFAKRVLPLPPLVCDRKPLPPHPPDKVL